MCEQHIIVRRSRWRARGTGGRSAGGSVGQLGAAEGLVEFAAGEEGIVRAVGDDAPGVHDEDAVGGAGGPEAVGDDDGGAAADEVGQGGADALLGLAVYLAERLVEDEDGGVAEDRAGQGDPLRLAAGEGAAGGPEDGVVAVGEQVDELVDERAATSARRGS